MTKEVVYTIQNDVNGKPIAARLDEDGARTGIYGPPGNIHGIRLLDHDPIIAALREMGYETIRFLSNEEFDRESERCHARRLGITVERWRQL